MLFISQSRLVEVKESLQETVVDKSYKNWLQKQKCKSHGMAVSARVLDEELWKRTTSVIHLSEPVVSILRLVGGGGAVPAVGKVYFRTYELVQHVDKLDTSSDDDRHTIKKCVEDSGQCYIPTCTALGLF